MKKKLLFVMSNLNCGGAEKALISLLQTLDYSKYEVDLFLFKHEGMFFEQIPANVNILGEPSFYKLFDMPVGAAMKASLLNGSPLLAIHRLLAGLILRTEKHPSVCEQRVWKHLSRALPRLSNRYDAAIGYMEKNPLYFVVEKTNAARKIGFIHNDYDKLGMDPVIDTLFFNKLDHLVTVSEECGVVLKNRFPDISTKVKVIHNIVSPELIYSMAAEETTWTPEPCIRLLSIGRLNYQKGFELAVEACKILIDSGYDIRWYVIGEGEDRAKLENLIESSQLQGIFILLGLKENPYSYLREADIYVQPSRFEGKSIAIDEAKIMGKPIIVTDFSTAKDQISSNHNGLIVEMNAVAVSNGVKRLIDNKELKNTLAQNLSSEQLGTESEIEKLYQLLV